MWVWAQFLLHLVLYSPPDIQYDSISLASLLFRTGTPSSFSEPQQRNSSRTLSCYEIEKWLHLSCNTFFPPVLLMGLHSRCSTLVRRACTDFACPWWSSSVLRKTWSELFCSQRAVAIAGTGIVIAVSLVVKEAANAGFTKWCFVSIVRPMSEFYRGEGAMCRENARRLLFVKRAYCVSTLKCLPSQVKLGLVVNLYSEFTTHIKLRRRFFSLPARKTANGMLGDST